VRLRPIIAIAAIASLLFGVTAADATTPGRNGRIVFSLQTASGVQLFTVWPDGSGLRQITHVDGDAVTADWSSDGAWIVFELDDADHAGVAIMRSDGSGLHDLTPTGFQGQPASTPDGTHIVYERFLPASGDDSLWVMNTDGTGRHRLTRNPFPGVGFDTDPNISPDGTTVSFVRVKEGDVLHALFTVRIDGSNLQRLTSYKLDVGVKHDWSPDGSRIAIIAHADFSPPGTSANVATIRPDGTGLRFLTHYRGGLINALTGSYSPDGRWITYRLENHGKFSLFKIRTYGVQAQPIRRFAEPPRYIDWGTNRDS
jgi:Tol biopolymer transport system component